MTITGVLLIGRSNMAGPGGSSPEKRPIYNETVNNKKRYGTADMTHERSTFFEKGRTIQKINVVVKVGCDDTSEPYLQPFPKRLWHGLLLQTAGQISYYYGDEEFVVKAGDIFYFPKGYEYKALARKLPSAGICVNFQTCEEEDTVPKVYRIEDSQANKELFESLNLQWAKEGNGFLCMKLLYEIMANVYTAQSFCYASPQKRMRFCEARDYIATYFTDSSLSPSIVADAVGISSVYLRKLFSRFAMMSPQEYIISCRIRYAKGLLKTEPLTVAAIAEMAGFEDVGYFSKKFKSLTGVTPTEYRTIDAE